MSGRDFNKERLDRATTNVEWSNLFDVVEVHVLPRSSLDHNLLLLYYSNSHETKWNKRRSFMYEAAWSKQQEPQRLIKQVWRVKKTSQDPWSNLHRKLEECRGSLQKWARKQNSLVEDQIQKAEQALSAFQMQEDGLGIESE
jgi:hypothetical protein